MTSTHAPASAEAIGARRAVRRRAGGGRARRADACGSGHVGHHTAIPELPEAERARLQLERVLGRQIVAVDERDTYVCRPHAPGEIAEALVGRRLTAAHRRGKFLWAETDDGGPDLGLHLGMAGRITVDVPPAPNHWDRFVLEFADGGRLALRDKRRLGRAVIEPDFSHVGPDAAEVSRDMFRARVGRGPSPEGQAARPEHDRGRRQPAGRRDAVARPALPAAGRRRAVGRRARPPAPSAGPPRRDPRGRRAHGPIRAGPRPRRELPALRLGARAGDDRRPHHLLAPASHIVDIDYSRRRTCRVRARMEAPANAHDLPSQVARPEDSNL